VQIMTEYDASSLYKKKLRHNLVLLFTFIHSLITSLLNLTMQKLPS